MFGLRKIILPKTIGEVLLFIFNGVFFILFLYLFLHSLIDNGAPYLSFSIKKVLLLIGIILLTLLLTSCLTDWIVNIVIKRHNLSENSKDSTGKENPVSKRIHQTLKKKQELQQRRSILYWIAGFIILFIVQILYTRIFYTSIGWDCGTIVNMAIGMLQGNSDSLGYLAQFPNNTALFLLLYYYFKICLSLGVTDLVFASVILNIVFLDIALAFLIGIAHKLWDNKIAVTHTLVLSILTIAFTPWLIVPYTDTLTMLFPIAFFYLYLCLSKQDNMNNKKLQTILLLVLGFLAYYGFKFKPSTVVFLIALGIGELCLKKISKQQLAIYGKKIPLMFCGVLVALTIFTVDESNQLGDYLQKDIYDTYQMPVSYFTMVGLQKQPVSEDKALWGAFNSEDYFAVSNITGKSAKNEYAVTTIRERINTFGFLGSLEFLVGKANFCFEDGTFFWGGEGNFLTSEAPSTTNPIGTWIQSFIYNSSKNYASVYSNLLQGVWMTLLFLMLLGIILAPNSYKNLPIMVLRIAIFGLLLYLLLLEARSRYIINYLPIFILLAVDGMLNLFTSLKSKKMLFMNNY